MGVYITLPVVLSDFVFDGLRKFWMFCFSNLISSIESVERIG